MHSVPIQLDKQRFVRIDAKAVTLAEDALGRSIYEMDLVKMKFGEAVKLLWAGLLHEDKSLTQANVLDLVSEHSNIIEINEVLNRAVPAAFGLPDPKSSEAVTGEQGNGQKG